MQKRPTHLTNRTVLAIAALAVTPMASHGQGSLPAQELIRRQAAVAEADTLLNEGREFYAKGKFKSAVDKYRAALDTLPYGTATTHRREVITNHLNDGAVALAQTNRRNGKYDEARGLLNEVQDNDPDNWAVKKQLEYLDDPIRTNPSLTYEHTQNVDKVRRLLYKGEGHYNLGLYDKAEDDFKNVLRIDPYNKAARRWMERCAAIKSSYYNAAYDQTRAQMLMEVDRAWELAVPPIGDDVFIDNDRTGPNEGVQSITEKLQTIRIPLIDFSDATVDEAIDFLRARSRELDTTTLDESLKGINFVVRKPRATGAVDDVDGLDAEGGLGASSDPGGARIDSLFLKNVPMQVALQYICDKAKLRYKVDEYAVTLLPLDATETDEIITRTWTVPPTFQSFLDDGGGGGGGNDGGGDPFADDAGSGAPTITARKGMRELLEDRGVSFPDGASAQYLAGSSSLLVRNTPTNLELIEAIVEASINDTPRQIKILTKFVEISQENGEELGFDWIVSPLGFGGAGPNSLGNAFFAGGGSIGSGVGRTGADFVSPIGPPRFATPIPGVPLATNQNVSQIVTGGLRSGDGAINRNSIDAILNNPNRTAQATNVAPGILSLTGIFGDGAVQMIMRGLSQKKGTDVMTAPSVMAKPGAKATIEIIREFIYPTEYEPPELPNAVGATNGGGGGVGGGGGGAGIFPVTPATPTTFETKNTGVTLEVEPNVGANGSVIDLRFAPQIIEFEGFVNYGSPITSPATDALGNPVQITITENRIEMPVFSVRRVNTGITIYDGYTVAVGGLIREDVQNVEDKVPILGDLPFVGRLFQTKAENHIKSNLIIFVTAQIIDATGRQVKGGSTPGAPVSSGSPVDSGFIGADNSLLPPANN